MSVSKEPARNKAASTERAPKVIVDAQDNPACTVIVDFEVPCLTVVWKRYATSSELREVHERLIELLREYRMSKILGDDSALPLIHSDDQAWIVRDWMPRAVTAGLRAAASKRPAAYFGRLAVENIIALQRLFTIRSFDDYGEARQWLKDHRSPE